VAIREPVNKKNGEEKERSQYKQTNNLQDDYLQTPDEGVAMFPGESSFHRNANLLAGARSDGQRVNLMMQLQQSHGNAYVQRLLSSRVVQAKLNVSQPGDEYEKEAEATVRSVNQGETVAVPQQKTADLVIAGSWTEPRNVSPEWNEYDRLRTLLERQYPEMSWEVVEEDRWGPRRWRVKVVSFGRPEELTRANILQWMRQRALGPRPPRAEETAPVSGYY